MQLDEIEWDFLRLIGTTNVNINAVEVQGIRDEEDELLKEAIAIWGILPKGVAELKKRVLENNVANITRSGKHYKPSFLENDHPGKDLREGSKPVEPRGKEDKEEEDRVLMQLKKTQAYKSMWGLLMASQKHCKGPLDILNGKELPIESTPQEVLSLMGVKGSSHPFHSFSNEDLPPEGASHTRPLQITVECMGAKVLMVLIDNGFALNVFPFRTALTVGLDMDTIIPPPLTVRAYDNTSRKVMGTFKAPCKIGPTETIMEFHIMDITPNYNLLLGRAWLHPNGAIPFSLHQKMKIPWKGGITIVLGDGEILAPVCGLEEEERSEL